jgi:hypothetical protein
MHPEHLGRGQLAHLLRPHRLAHPTPQVRHGERPTRLELGHVAGVVGGEGEH